MPIDKRTIGIALLQKDQLTALLALREALKEQS